MRRVTALSTLALVGLLATACTPQPGRGGAAAQQAVAEQAARQAAADTPAEAPAPSAPAVTKNACSDAALTLAADEVIARVNGADVKASELGDDLRRAEQEALRTYCGEIARVRQEALEREVDRRVLDVAAKAEGKEIEAFLDEKMKAAVPEPTEEDLLDFYNKHKSPQAPPFEMVKDQVMAAMVDEKTNKALEELVGGLRRAAKVEPLLPDVRPPPHDLRSDANNASTGDQNGVVEVVEFSDFECPYCSRAADTLRQLKARYPEKVRFTFRHFPLSFHPNAKPAAEHAQCAHEQGRFWEYHDLVFAAQRELSVDKLGELADQAGLDRGKLSECLSSGRASTQVAADMAKANEVGVGGTPSFYINGRAFAGNPTPDGIAAAIDAELAQAGS